MLEAALMSARKFERKIIMNYDFDLDLDLIRFSALSLIDASLPLGASVYFSLAAL